MTYTRPTASDPGTGGGPTDLTVVLDALSDGLEAVEAALPGKASTSHDHSGAYDPAGSAAAAQAAAIAASQPVDSDLTAIAALTTTAYGRAFLALADAAAGRTALGLGTAATAATGDFQPVDSDLTAIAALTTTSFGRAFLTLADAAAGRTALGLGGAATLAVGTTTGTVAAGDDSRLTDARTPTSHASSHLPGGADALTTAAGSTQAFGDSAATGSAASFSRSDHKHAMPADPKGLPLALTGATAATRYVGATASGAPASGTFAVGDFVIEQTGKVYVCTVAGTPGTWVQVGSGGGGYATIKNALSSLTQRTAVSFAGVGVTSRDNSSNSQTRVVVGGAYADPQVTGAQLGAAIEATCVPGSDIVLAAGDAIAVPIIVSHSIISIDRIGFQVTSAGGTAEVGIYNSLSTIPSSLQASATGMSVASTGFKSGTFTAYDFTTQAEWASTLYWLAVLALGSSVTVRGATLIYGQQSSPFNYYSDLDSIVAWKRTGLSALPASTFYSGATGVTTIPRLQARRSA